MKKVALPLFVCVLAFLPVAMLSAQEVIGSIIYIEGSVRIQKSGAWTNAQMKQQLHAGEAIETGGDGSVEIRWVNNAKTVIESGRRQDVKSLFDVSGKSAKSGADGMWANFKQIFKKGANERQTEGGIRRSMADLNENSGKGDLYFKLDEEVNFDSASVLYQSQNYPKAAHAFRLFLEQRPKDSHARMAMFALGHCYVEMNNIPEAKRTLQTFVSTYGDDELASQARSILDKF
jgi:TolA-binding protein